MKKTIISSFIIALCLLIIPLKNVSTDGAAARQAMSGSVLPALGQSSAKAEEASSQITHDKEDADFFRIKTEDGIVNIAESEYLAGVIAAEMPVSYGQEALKAQCIAAYSFALYRKNSRKSLEYDLTDSYKTDQAYLCDDALKEKWGDSYDEKMKIIKGVVSEVKGEYLSFDGSPALTVYHAVSSGKTNACADVFGSQVAYLVPVDSEGDRLAPNYKSVISFSVDEIKEKLNGALPATDKGYNIFSDIKTSKGGYVKSVSYGGKTVSGSEVSKRLSLPCTTFTVTLSENTYTFTCLGRGHGVGMSQYGAKYMAQGGSSYKEILAHYYPGTKLVEN